MSAEGYDCDDNVLPRLEEFWKLQRQREQHANDVNDQEKWYVKSLDYWRKSEASVNGVLGGFGFVSSVDIAASKRFIHALGVNKGCALDCGAGIGRVSRGLLLPQFELVDLVEPAENLVEQAKKDLVLFKNLGDVFQVGAQDFSPTAGKYDMIWIQWVLLYLTDEDLVSFLKRCLAGLKEGGLICVKENITSGSRYFYDRDDNSVTRNDSQFKRVFGAAGLKLVLEMDQDRFPQDLFTVRMYALAGQ